MALVMKVGGASGPLYGSLFMAHGQGARRPQRDRGASARSVAPAIDAVAARGKSTVGREDDARRAGAGAGRHQRRRPKSRRAREGGGRTRRPPRPFRCARPRGAPPFSASGASAIWTPARDRARSSSKPFHPFWNNARDGERLARHRVALARRRARHGRHGSPDGRRRGQGRALRRRPGRRARH